MAHAAAAAALPLRHPLLFLKEARLLSSLAPPLPSIRHPRTLRSTGPLPSDAEDTDDPDAGQRRRRLLQEEPQRTEAGGPPRREVGNGPRQVLPASDQVHPQCRVAGTRGVRCAHARQGSYIRSFSRRDCGGSPDW